MITFEEGDRIVDPRGETATVEQVRGLDLAVVYDWQVNEGDRREPTNPEPYWVFADGWTKIPPADGTPEAEQARWNARGKLARVRGDMTHLDIERALRRVGLCLHEHSYEATANALIEALPGPLDEVAA